MGLGQPVVVARARAPCDAAVQHCFVYLGSYHPEFELASYVTYAQVDLDGRVGNVVDISPEAYDLICLVVHLNDRLYAKNGCGLRHPLCA